MRLILIYRPVPGYEGLYEASATGVIKNSQTNRVVADWTNEEGRVFVSLSKDSVSKTYQVSKIVAIIFVPNPYNLPVVNHLDNNPKHNWANNLEWSTQQNNCLDYHRRQKFFTSKILQNTHF